MHKISNTRIVCLALALAGPVAAPALAGESKSRVAANAQSEVPGFGVVESTLEHHSSSKAGAPAAKPSKGKAAGAVATPAVANPQAAAIPAAIVSTPAAIEAEKPPEHLVPERKLVHETDDETEQLLANALAAGFKGPDRITLNEQASLVIPAGRIFIRASDLRPLLAAVDGTLEPETLGILIEDTLEPQYLIYVDWEKTGYIKDDEAKTWDVDKLLDSYRSGVAAQNASRASSAQIEITGWAERPAYDARMHRLVHAIAARHKGDTDASQRFMNYSAYALGREGMFNIILAADLADLDKYRDTAKKVLGGVSFAKGKAYEDADAAHDSIAPFTLAALAGGAIAAKKMGGLALAGKAAAGAAVAAKKFGLLKLLGLFLLKFWKLAAAGLAAIGIFARKMMGRK